MCQWYTDAKDAFLEIPDIKQIAEAYSELYDNSAVGQVLPSEAIWRYILKPRMEAYKSSVKMFEFDRKAGRFVAEVDIPVEASDIIKYVAYGTQPKPASRTSTKLTSAMEYFTDAMAKTFDGRATIVEGKHFVTFDGLHYSAHGQCSYLLARDFADGNFTVIMKSGDELSYVVRIDTNTIEINTAKKTITLNDVQVESPLYVDEITITRDEDKIEINDPSTLRFTYHLDREVATLDLRVWYFGKTAGLLGNYNREPRDDMVTPAGLKVDDEQVLLRNWETMRGCRSKTMLFRELVKDTSDEYKMCEKFFKDEDSPMASGFWLPSTEKYFDLCLRVAQSSIHKTDAMCRVATAYLLEVKHWDVSDLIGARLPNECRE